jgi:2,4-dienoyl-CoA reductase-like NADH-dependent reductase (Old Yellow Enzyme family)/thioredoxin reductase
MSLHTYEHVFTPIQIGPVTLKNRIMGLPMMDGMPDPKRGFVTPEMLAHMRLRAKSGAGLIVIGDSPIDYNRAADHYAVLNLGDEANLPGLCHLAEEAHRYGTKISVELAHGGIVAKPAITGNKPYAVSPWPEHLRVRGAVDIHLPYPDEIDLVGPDSLDEIIESYCAAADRVMRAGFDMIMVHSGHNWFLHQFLSPVFNRREDEYGGSLENRMRFPLRVFEAVRKTVGNKMAIDMRVTGDPRIRGENKEMPFEDLVTYLKAVSGYADAVNVSASMGAYPLSSEYMCQSYYLPHMVNSDLAARIKASGVTMKVSACGSFVTLAQAERFIAEGKADFIGIGRALYADDKAVLKEFRGQKEKVRPCVRCAYCTDRLGTKFMHVRCAVNPLVGRMDEYPNYSFPRAACSKRVMIVGGGVAGMQAAQTAAQRGHQVILYEKADHLGGMIEVAAALPDKYDMRRYLKWMCDTTWECGAEIHLNSDVSAETIRAEAPDAVLVAIGSVPARPPIPGLDGSNVVWVGDVDSGKSEVGQKVVIAGAGLAGAECAVPLVRAKKQVTLVDMMPEADFLRDASGQVAVSLRRIFLDEPITTIFDARITRVTGAGVEYVGQDGERRFLACDTVIHALGRTIDEQKVDELMSVVPETFSIGDCAAGDKSLLHAIESAFAFAMEL